MGPIPHTHKLCKQCNTVWNKGDFHRMTKSLDGRQPYCKECSKEWHRAYVAPILRGNKGPRADRAWDSERWKAKVKHGRLVRRVLREIGSEKRATRRNRKRAA